jgi:hypothetical protein
VGISPKSIEDTTKLATLNLQSSMPLVSMVISQEYQLRHLDRDLNALVFDYLLIEGFPSAAVEFARETGLPHDIDHDLVRERMEIRECVEEGRVEEAVRRVNELDPEVSFSVPLNQEEEIPPGLDTSCTTLSQLIAWPCGNNR